jgi:hypothetical protein
MLTIVISTGGDLEIEWQAPLHDVTFDRCASMVLRHITAVANHQSRSLRDLLAEAILESYITYVSSPDDETDPANIMADNQLKVFLKLFSDHVGSPNFTLCVSRERIMEIQVEPLATPEAEVKAMIQAALLAEEARASNRSRL